MPSLTGSFTAVGQTSSPLFLRVPESASIVLSGTYVGTVVLEKKLGTGAWKIMRVFLSTANTTIVNDSPENWNLRLRCAEFTSGTISYTLADVDGDFIYERSLPDGRQALGVTDEGDLYVLGALFSGGGGGTITLQTDEGTFPVGSLFTFTSADASVVVTGDEVTDEIDFVVDPAAGALATALGLKANAADYTTTAALTTLLAGKQDTGNYITALTGDVTASGPGSVAATIGNNKVTNAMLATVATATFKGRTTASTGNVEDLTVTQATALLNVFGADAGSGGVKGLVPATVAGDSAKFLKGNGTWAAITAIGGSSGAVDNALLRADGTGGSTVQSSAVTMDDTTGAMTWPAAAAHRAIYIPSTTALSTTNNRYVEVTGTLNPASSATVIGALLDFVTGGANNGNLVGARFRLQGGHTGTTSLTAAAQYFNAATSAGADLWNSQGNIGAVYYVNGSTAGHNAGISVLVENGKRNIGAIIACDTTPNGGTGVSVGVLSSAHPGNGSNDRAAGGYFELMDTGVGAVSTIPNVVAALIAGNTTNTGSVCILYDNTTKIFEAKDGGDIQLGLASVATNATKGFPYIPANTGAPSGTPTGITGMVPMYYDSTNDHLYIYRGGWKKTTVFA